MSQSTTKQHQHPQPQLYELLYHPGIPGRGEFIRLAFEVTGTPYTDIANSDPENGYAIVQNIAMDPSSVTEISSGNPPPFAPPALRIRSEDGAELVIGQTSNILFYLGEKLGLNGMKEEEKFFVNQVALTALDLSNEVHDSHHPIAVSKFYEEQKGEALKRSEDLRGRRIPKFLGYFERVLRGNHGGAGGKFMVGEGLTYADLVVWQVLDGLLFAFPKEMEVRKGEFGVLFEFYERLKEVEGLKGYLNSGRRLPYGDGLFRNYPELDRQ